MLTQRLSSTGITVTGAGNTASSIIALSEDFTPAAGCVYDILLRTQIPANAEGTILVLSNGTDNWYVYQNCNGNYSRARGLTSRKVLRVQFFDDPSHFNLFSVRC